ncbi:hypothetical protein DP116_13330 [Brasilonema bromeliae SPC951]|uniref:Uncharacterized protein n=1 Tax=Brasilonema bromeliae SPC951 TaxID=385972 RepID=A0ABX1PA08_9CYAN|nr:hypothetical protein [Brasilonema bromeliae SPC951]
MDAAGPARQGHVPRHRRVENPHVQPAAVHPDAAAGVGRVSVERAVDDAADRVAGVRQVVSASRLVQVGRGEQPATPAAGRVAAERAAADEEVVVPGEQPAAVPGRRLVVGELGLAEGVGDAVGHPERPAATARQGHRPAPLRGRVGVEIAVGELTLPGDGQGVGEGHRPAVLGGRAVQDPHVVERHRGVLHPHRPAGVGRPAVQRQVVDHHPAVPVGGAADVEEPEGRGAGHPGPAEGGPVAVQGDERGRHLHRGGRHQRPEGAAAHGGVVEHVGAAGEQPDGVGRVVRAGGGHIGPQLGVGGGGGDGRIDRADVHRRHVAGFQPEQVEAAGGQAAVRRHKVCPGRPGCPAGECAVHPDCAPADPCQQGGRRHQSGEAAAGVAVPPAAPADRPTSPDDSPPAGVLPAG